jgi:predicted nucleic acid-binding protein
MRLVQDSNVFVAALRSGAGTSRALLRRLLAGQHTPLLGDKLWLEYQDLLSRGETFWRDCELDAQDRHRVLEAFAAVCEYVRVPRLWRPNLPDEGDNHVMELAIYGNAGALVTFNTADFTGGHFAPAGLAIVTPGDFLKNYAA